MKKSILYEVLLFTFVVVILSCLLRVHITFAAPEAPPGLEPISEPTTEAEKVTEEVESETEDVSAAEEKTEATEETVPETEKESGKDLNDRLIENVTQGGLGAYWDSSVDKLTRGTPNEDSFMYRTILSASIFVRRGGWVLAILSLLVGAFMYAISGLNKPMRTTALFLMIGVPIIAITFAFIIPITASIFYYGK